MADLAGALKETPLPTIFVLAGIVFWLLAIAGSIAGKVTVLPGQQRTAAVVGTLFVFLGMGLYLVPGRGNDRASGRTEAVSTTSVQQTAPAATNALLTASFKIKFILDRVAPDGDLDATTLASAVDKAAPITPGITPGIARRLKNYKTVSDLKEGLRVSDQSAVDPLFNALQ